MKANELKEAIQKLKEDYPDCHVFHHSNWNEIIWIIPRSKPEYIRVKFE